MYHMTLSHWIFSQPSDRSVHTQIPANFFLGWYVIIPCRILVQYVLTVSVGIEVKPHMRAFFDVMCFIEVKQNSWIFHKLVILVSSKFARVVVPLALLTKIETNRFP